VSVSALPSTARSTYRHGDLREALVAAGVDLARAGGPDAVVLRETTRRVGVSPNAAYRHFADRQALLKAVSDRALGFVADRIEDEVVAIPMTDAATHARSLLRAVGTGYIAFAREEPGLFRTAFSVPDNLASADAPSKAGAGGRTPYQLVGMALDEMLAAGLLPAERRPNAEFLAWSSVHGLGMLVIDGPLRGLTGPMIDNATQRVIDMVERGL
jgi:AcrR family transcriptional regulator